MLFPWTDWQFWLVTACAVCGLAMVVRLFLPRRKTDDSPCAHCATGASAHAAMARRRDLSRSWDRVRASRTRS